MLTRGRWAASNLHSKNGIVIVLSAICLSVKIYDNSFASTCTFSRDCSETIIINCGLCRCRGCCTSIGLGMNRWRIRPSSIRLRSWSPLLICCLSNPWTSLSTHLISGPHLVAAEINVAVLSPPFSTRHVLFTSWIATSPIRRLGTAPSNSKGQIYAVTSMQG